MSFPTALPDSRVPNPKDAPSLHQTFTFPLDWQSRVDSRPEVVRSEPFLTAMGRWRLPGRGESELCMIVGTRLDEGSLGALTVLTPELRAALAEPGTVVIDDWEFPTFGLHGTGYEAGEVNGQPVRLAGTVHGFHGFAFVYVFCSQETLRMLAPQVAEHPEQVTCLAARCRGPRDVDPGRRRDGIPGDPADLRAQITRGLYRWAPAPGSGRPR